MTQSSSNPALALRVCEKTYCARNLAFRRCSGSSCISIYTAVARLVLETRPCGACAPFRSRRNAPALRRNATFLRSRRFFYKLSGLVGRLRRSPTGPGRTGPGRVGCG